MAAAGNGHTRNVVFVEQARGLLGLVARGKVRGTSTATPGMKMSRVFIRGAGVVCTEAQNMSAAKRKCYS